MTDSRSRPEEARLAAAFEALEALKAPFAAESANRAVKIRSCKDCGDCCVHPMNAMLATQLEAEALLDRLERDPELAPRRQELLAAVHEAIERFELLDDEDEPRPYTCPFYDASDGGRCLVHGRGQPLGCTVYRPVGATRCDMPASAFEASVERLREIEDEAFGELGPILTIPVAVARALRARDLGESDGERRPAGDDGDD